MQYFIIMPPDHGFAIQREDGFICAKLPFGSTYSDAKCLLENFRSHKACFQLTLDF